MPHPSFDPSKAVTFDLAHGQIFLDESATSLLLPAGALLPLFEGRLDDKMAAFARAVGNSFGQSVARSFGDGAAAPNRVLAASVDAVVDHLGGQLALTGFGSLRLERWGQALVLFLDSVPFRESGDDWVALLLAAALESATGRNVGCLPLMHESGHVRFLVAKDATVKKAQRLLQQGITWGETLARLHTQQAES